MAEDPDIIEWHPPHLEKPILIYRSVQAKKPMRPAVRKLGIALFGLGLGIEASVIASFGRQHSEDALTLLMVMASFLIAPISIVAGAIILALEGTLKPWLVAGAFTVITFLGSYGGLFGYEWWQAESDCKRDHSNACVDRARLAFRPADAAPFDKRACELGNLAGCKRWDHEDPNATANETFRAYCDSVKSQPHVPYRDGHIANDPYECKEPPDLKGWCAKSSFDYECR
jgi:hypothetical protein